MRNSPGFDRRSEKILVQRWAGGLLSLHMPTTGSGGRLQSAHQRWTYSDRQGQHRTDTTQLDHPATSVSWFGAVPFCDFTALTCPPKQSGKKRFAATPADGSPGQHHWQFVCQLLPTATIPLSPEQLPWGYYNGTVHGSFKTHDARSYYGCYDMAGNAREWTADYWFAANTLQ